IADFVQCVPRRHLKSQIAMHIGHVNGHMEKMLRRICERQLIRNRGMAWQYNHAEAEEMQGRQCAKMTETKGEDFHRELASAGVRCGAFNFFRSFSQSPSKLPLDMMSSRSLGLAFAARKSAMASPPETTLASL